MQKSTNKKVRFAKEESFDEASIKKIRTGEVYCLCDLPNYIEPKIACDGCHTWHNLGCFALKEVNSVQEKSCLPCRKVRLWTKLRDSIKKNTPPTLQQLKNVGLKLGIDTVGKQADLIVRLAVFLIESPTSRIKILTEGHLDPCRTRCQIGEVSQMDAIMSLSYQLLRTVCKECVGISKGSKAKFVTVFHQFLTKCVPCPKVISVLSKKINYIPVVIQGRGSRWSQRVPLKPLNADQHSQNKKKKEEIVKKKNNQELAKQNLINEEKFKKQKLVAEKKLIHKQKLACKAIEQKLAMFNITQLRQECNQVNVFSKGNKAQLVSRLAQHILKKTELEDEMEKIKSAQHSKSKEGKKQRKQKLKHSEDCDCDLCDLEFALILSNMEI